MEWVQRMNNIRERVTEMVNAEVVFVLRNNLMSQGKYTDGVDDILIKFTKSQQARESISRACFFRRMNISKKQCIYYY